MHLLNSADNGPLYRLLDRRTIALARLDERERIAMDLHDGVMQSLYAVGLGLATRERLLAGDDEAARAALRAAEVQIDGVIQQVRDYVSDLRPRERGARGLRDGLNQMVLELWSGDLPRPEIRVDAGADGLLAPEAAAHLLYVAREATSNAIRHAGASAVSIRLTRSEGGLCLTVRDDGRGFDVTRQAAGDGLRNMRARAKQMGGRLALRSEIGQSTEVRLELRLPGARVKTRRAA